MGSLSLIFISKKSTQRENLFCHSLYNMSHLFFYYILYFGNLLLRTEFQSNMKASNVWVDSLLICDCFLSQLNILKLLFQVISYYLSEYFVNKYCISLFSISSRFSHSYNNRVNNNNNFFMI